MKIILSPLRNSILLLLYFTASVSPSHAQLSGTKVIGTGGNYTTFTAAVNALNTQGISASVVFNVKPGTYNEQISINAIAGASATKTITFQSQNSDSTSVILQYPSLANGTNNYVVQLYGSDYITFQKMTIRRTDTLAYAGVIDVSNGATHNRFLNNVLTGTTKPSITTFTAIISSTNTMDDSYNTFSNNIVQGGGFGMYYLGQGSTLPDYGTVITNNHFINQNYRAIYLTSQNSVIINNNIISTNTANTSYYGIYCQYCNDSLKMIKNKLSVSTGYGIYLQNCNETSSHYGLIANNFISIGGSSTAWGIYLNNVKMECLYYNSIHIYSTDITAGRAVNLSGPVTNSINFYDDILANTGGGYAIYVDPVATALLLGANSNYNDLYTTGTYVGYWKSNGNEPTLANWQSASSADAQSLTANPMFVTATDLHCTSGNIHAAGSSTFLYFTVTDDIDGQNRNNPPCIGADEFNIDNVGISSIAFNPSFCQYDTATISVHIRNYSAWAYHGNVPVFYQLGGGAIVNETTGIISLPAGDSVLHTFTTKAALNNPGLIHLRTGTSLLTDINKANDTLANANINVWVAPIANAGPDVYVCLGDSVTLTAAAGGDSYSWNTLPPRSTQSITVLVSDTTVFIVTVSSSNGCSSKDTVVVTPGIFPAVVADFSWSAVNMDITFTDQSTSATGWRWNFGDGDTSIIESPVHTYAANGNYNVVLIAYNGCHSDTITKSVSVVGIAENAMAGQFLITPNPAKEKVDIKYPSDIQINDIIIRDLSGKYIRHLHTIISNSIDLNDIAEGMYFMLFNTDKGLIGKKLLIQR